MSGKPSLLSGTRGNALVALIRAHRTRAGSGLAIDSISENGTFLSARTGPRRRNAGCVADWDNNDPAYESDLLVFENVSTLSDLAGPGQSVTQMCWRHFFFCSGNVEFTEAGDPKNTAPDEDYIALARSYYPAGADDTADVYIVLVFYGLYEGFHPRHTINFGLQYYEAYVKIT